MADETDVLEREAQGQPPPEGSEAPAGLPTYAQAWNNPPLSYGDPFTPPARGAPPDSTPGVRSAPAPIPASITSTPVAKAMAALTSLPRGELLKRIAAAGRTQSSEPRLSPDPTIDPNAPPPPPPDSNILLDTGKAISNAAVSGVQDVIGFAQTLSRYVSGNPELWSDADNIKQVLEDHAKFQLGNRMEAASKMSLFDPETRPKTPGQIRDYLLYNSAVALPQMAMAVIPGGVAADAVSALAVKGGVKAAALLGRATGGAVEGGAFGVLTTGDAYNAVQKEIKDATPEEMAQSKLYLKHRAEGMDDKQARTALLGDIAPSFGLENFGAGIVGGLGGGFGLGAGVKGLAARTAAGAAQGAVGMGGQAAIQADALKKAYDAAGLDSSKLATPLQAGLEGAVGGAALGGITGALHGGGAPATVERDRAQVAPDVHAATEELGPAGPTGPMEPTKPPSESGAGSTLGAEGAEPTKPTPAPIPVEPGDPGAGGALKASERKPTEEAEPAPERAAPRSEGRSPGADQVGDAVAMAAAETRTATKPETIAKETITETSRTTDPALREAAADATSLPADEKAGEAPQPPGTSRSSGAADQTAMAGTPEAAAAGQPAGQSPVVLATPPEQEPVTLGGGAGTAPEVDRQQLSGQPNERLSEQPGEQLGGQIGSVPGTPEAQRAAEINALAAERAGVDNTAQVAPIGSAPSTEGGSVESSPSEKPQGPPKTGAEVKQKVAAQKAAKAQGVNPAPKPKAKPAKAPAPKLADMPLSDEQAEYEARMAAHYNAPEPEKPIEPPSKGEVAQAAAELRPQSPENAWRLEQVQRATSARVNLDSDRNSFQRNENLINLRNDADRTAVLHEIFHAVEEKLTPAQRAVIENHNLFRNTLGEAQRLYPELDPAGHHMEAMAQTAAQLRAMHLDRTPVGRVLDAIAQPLRAFARLVSGDTAPSVRDVLHEAFEGNRASRAADGKLRKPISKMPSAEQFSRFPAVQRRTEDTIGAALRHAGDTGGSLSRAAHTAALHGMSTDAIVRQNRDLFNDGSLDQYRENTAAKNKTSSDYYRKYSDFSDQMGRALKKSPELNSLVNEMGYADVKLDGIKTKADFEKINGPRGLLAGDVWDRYQKLSPADKATYGKLVGYYGEAAKTVRDARINRFAETFDLHPGDVAQLKAAATPTEFEQLSERFERRSNKEPLGDRFDQLVKASEIARMVAPTTVHGDYTPLRRYGDWRVQIGQKGKADYELHSFETQGAAQRFRDSQKDKTGVSQPFLKRDSQYVDDLLAQGTLSKIMDRVSKDPKLVDRAADIKNLLGTMALDTHYATEQRMSGLQRNRVRGADTNQARVLANHIMSTGRTLAVVKHGGEISKALRDMQERADALRYSTDASKQPLAQMVVQEMERRENPDSTDDLVSRIAQNANTFGYLHSLLSMSHAVTSSIEAHTSSLPIMGARHGLAANGALFNAFKTFAPHLSKDGLGKIVTALRGHLKDSDYDYLETLKKLAPDVAHVLDRANDFGLLQHTNIDALRQSAEGRGGSIRQYLIHLAATANASTEALNRASILKAAYDLELKRTGDKAASTEYALDVLRQAMPNYAQYNRSGLARRAYLRPLLQFKGYGMHMYSMMGTLAKETWNGDRQAAGALLGVLAGHAAMAGIAGSILPINTLGGLYDLTLGDGKTHDYKAALQSWLGHQLGPEIGEVLSKGLPHALPFGFGIDLHRRVGTSNLLEFPELNSLKLDDIEKAATKFYLGASGEDAVAYAAALGKALNGDWQGVLPALLPRIAGDVAKAGAFATTGAMSGQHQLLTPDQIGLAGMFTRAFGFNPAVVEEAQAAHSAVREARETAAADKAAIVKRVAADPSRAGDVAAWNAAHPEARINQGDVLKARNAARQAASNVGQIAGIKAPTKNPALAAMMRDIASGFNAPTGR